MAAKHQHGDVAFAGPRIFKPPADLRSDPAGELSPFYSSPSYLVDSGYAMVNISSGHKNLNTAGTLIMKEYPGAEAAYGAMAGLHTLLAYLHFLDPQQVLHITITSQPAVSIITNLSHSSFLSRVSLYLTIPIQKILHALKIEALGSLYHYWCW